MRVDFYQLTRDPAELVLPALARLTLGAGERLLVVSEDGAQLDRIEKALWDRPDSFLANGRAGGAHDARQPILLSGQADPANGAKFLALADGVWRDMAGATRVFLLFPPDRIDDARACWRMLGQREGVERKYWRQDGGKWREGP
ncbi:DNA polymerase III subunit chi [Novosphingobium cyanobacteriorum]|uniref:DNA polymerase III subunit chi n=1 Tax=Novosphingobium cyanobacteriorum TaxID=3024215 RepID=A0ABT6CJZ8_9SPHN|nr:DNA polymerase III subunit chi [Novosphingobium cyanobacteriorum]MDF8332672.1 DNA polymerase III subunit chi [Novosphingobium cyanobacteriorum]